MTHLRYLPGPLYSRVARLTSRQQTGLCFKRGAVRHTAARIGTASAVQVRSERRFRSK